MFKVSNYRHEFIIDVCCKNTLRNNDFIESKRLVEYIRENREWLNDEHGTGVVGDLEYIATCYDFLKYYELDYYFYNN
jgi:hypothetical protein